MTTSTRVRSWWETAPNPDCVDWCLREHPEGDFAVGGGMVCVKPFEGNGWQVEVQCFVGVNDAETAIERDPANVDVTILTGDFLAVRDAYELAAAIAEAASIARRTSTVVGSRP